MQHPSSIHQNLKFEIARKLIHLSSVAIAILYCFMTRELALLLLFPLFAGFLLVDLLKNVVPSLSRWYHRTFDPMLREHELARKWPQLNGATFISFSALFLVLFFPKLIAITCFALVAVSDTMAALFGKKFGKHMIGTKSLEGSLAFLVSALVIVAIVPGLDRSAGILTALFATIAEALSLQIKGYKIDDNLTIPLSSAIVCYLYYLLVLPDKLPLLDMCP